MDFWGWVLLYAVALVVFQLLVYRYLWRREEPLLEHGTYSVSDGDEERRVDVRSDRQRTMWVDTRANGAEPLERRCPHCGTINEPEVVYTFCRNCAGRLA